MSTVEIEVDGIGCFCEEHGCAVGARIERACPWSGAHGSWCDYRGGS